MAVGCNETEGEVQRGHDRQQVIGEQETDDKDITRCVMWPAEDQKLFSQTGLYEVEVRERQKAQLTGNNLKFDMLKVRCETMY